MKKITHKVNVDNIPDEYKCLVKDEMTHDEIAVMGNVLIQHKFSKFKEKIKNKFKRSKR